MNDTPLLRRSTAEGVTTATLARPQRGNALSEALVEQLMDAVADAAADASVHTLVLRGEGPHFCTGFDLGADADAAPDGAAARDGPLLWRFARVEQLLGELWHAPLRTVAVAQGRAWGAGADLFAACDLRYAVQGAEWRFPGAGFGLVLGTRRLARVVGEAVALDWVAHGRRIECGEALGRGFATAVVPAAGDAQAPIPPLAVDRATYARLKAATRPDRRDADLAALVRSACRPGLAERVRAYRRRRQDTLR
ncbi:MAG: enoyl-CoA hydratase/isomerase family protein [Ottowia sp.]|uniref:enoyl-CoA hydratase/isomerase family protein n=1 Tax=Ottowia sp. TaxID=1898956 RepID=UPI0039E590F2